MRPQRNFQVMSWLKECPVEELAVTAISIAEISYGLKRLPEGRRRHSLRGTFPVKFNPDRAFPHIPKTAIS